MTCGIYRITHRKTERHYIGQSVDIESRFKDHLSGKGSRKISNAIHKYGPDAFDFVVVLQCEREKLNLHEVEAIAKYNSLHPNGFNLIAGGGQPGSMSMETRERFREAGKRRMADPAYRERHQQMVKKTHSDPAWRQRQSEFMKERMGTPEARAKSSLVASEMNRIRWGAK